MTMQEIIAHITTAEEQADHVVLAKPDDMRFTHPVIVIVIVTIMAIDHLSMQVHIHAGIKIPDFTNWFHWLPH